MSKLDARKRLGRFAIEDLAYLRRDAKPLTCLSIFSGCGGAALGIAAAGFEVRVFVEFDKYACETLRRNWTDELGRRTVRYKTQRCRPVIIQRDISAVPTAELLSKAKLRIGEATVLEGGFPCQGFSTANSRRDPNDHTKDKRNRLYLELVRILKETLPKFCVFENVPGLVSMENGRVIQMILGDFARAGYELQWDILNAADYGVPQNRRRVFIIGQRNDVAVMKSRGRVEYHIGAAAGPVHHPEWFLKKFSGNGSAKRASPQKRAA